LYGNEQPFVLMYH